MSLSQDDKKYIRSSVGKALTDIMPVLFQRELKPIKHAFSQQELMLKEMRIDLKQVKQSVRHQGILYEDLNDRLKADNEFLRDNLKVKNRVDDHEGRIAKVETTQNLLKKTVSEHSKQLKSKPA